MNNNSLVVSSNKGLLSIFAAESVWSRNSLSRLWKKYRLKIWTRNGVKSVQDFLFTDQIEKFEYKLTTHFYKSSIDFLELKGTKKQLTSYLTNRNIVFRFLSFIKGRESSKQFLDIYFPSLSASFYNTYPWYSCTKKITDIRLKY